MKYIHIVPSLVMSGGGVESVVTDLCEAMATQSKDVFIITLFKQRAENTTEQLVWSEKTGVDIICMQQKDSESLVRILIRLRRAIKRIRSNQPCCLFLHLKWAVLAGILSSLCLSQIKRIEVYHSDYQKYKLQALFSKPFLAHYIAVSKDAKRQLLNEFHIKEERTSVINNGVNIREIRRIASTFTKPQNTNLSFLSVGRLTHQKGFTTSIRAYVRLRETGRIGESSYAIIGDGDQRQKCEALGKNWVRFSGSVKREFVIKQTASADVIVMPSLWEGNSIYMLEAMAIGKPLLLTDIPAFREVFRFSPLMEAEICRKEWFGVVFRGEDESSCENAFSLIYGIQDELTDMAREVYSFSDRFSTERQAKQYIELANKVWSHS